MNENFDLSKDGVKIPVKEFAFNEANNYREKNDFGVFNNYLDILFDTIVKTIKPDSEKKAKLINEYEDKIKQKDAEKSKLIDEKSKLSNDISKLKNKIEANKSELELLNKGQMKRPYIELTFLSIAMLILTIFIWIYYSSSMYGINTYTKSTEDILAVSLNSFSFLINDPSPTSIFYLCMPIIFFVMGYLVHNRREQSKKRKLIFILITLIIDIIIGYILTMKNYNNNRAFDEPVFSFEMLLSGMGLYFILFIFLGFGAYIMWGYLFETITHIWEKSTVSNAILFLKNNINDLNAEIITLELNIEQINSLIDEIRKKVNEYSDIVNNIKNNKIIFSKTKFDGSIAISISEWLRSTQFFEPNRNQQSDNLAIKKVAESWKEFKYKTVPANIIFID